MRVFDLSITCSLNTGKFLQPDVPASTTVVTPLRNVKSSGETLREPSANVSGLLPVKTCVWISMNPGVIYNPVASIVFFEEPVSMPLPIFAIFPSFTAMSDMASILFFGAIM